MLQMSRVKTPDVGLLQRSVDLLDMLVMRSAWCLVRDVRFGARCSVFGCVAVKQGEQNG